MRTRTKSIPNAPRLIDIQTANEEANAKGQTAERLQRLDLENGLKEKILPYCRLKYGEVWEDPVGGHRIGVLDATKAEDVRKIIDAEKAKLIICDPPYNIAVGNANTTDLFSIDLNSYMEYSKKWIRNAVEAMQPESSIYIWIGADYRNDFQPLPDLMLLLRHFKELKPKNYITVRNQRGYGTQKNWMWVRQDLLCYTKGSPVFNVEAEYTDIPKILRGYYKEVNGKTTENLERSKSKYIRAGNIWVDIQQVFYRMEENVPGCYAQKPLKATSRIIMSASNETDLVVDFFAHSGSTLIAGEMSKRKVYTFDVNPLFAEVSIRRLENFRKTGKTGWQWRSPFPEVERETGIKRWT